MEYKEDQDISPETGGDVEYISREGYEKICTELQTLKTVERIHVAERLEYAKSLGDLSENAEFEAAKEEQMLNEMRISELENLLRRASVVVSNGPSSSVTIGSRITVKTASAAASETYAIVGSSEEADPIKGNVSQESPLGRAFLGHKKGEKVKVTTPRGEIEYVIMDIS